VTNLLLPVSALLSKIILSSHIQQTAILPPDTNVHLISKKVPKLSNTKKSYPQTSKANISLNVENVLHIKEVFPTLSADKVTRIIKVKNSSKGQKKSKINMMTKGLSRKQIIIPMVRSNAELIINLANQPITNINKSLKEIKSDITVDFIHIINNRVIITTDKPANTSNLKIIEKYIKNVNNINSEAIESS